MKGNVTLCIPCDPSPRTKWEKISTHKMEFCTVDHYLQNRKVKKYLQEPRAREHA